MVSREEEKYDELLRRIVRVEVLASLAFVGSDVDADVESRNLLRRYFRDYYRRSSLSGKQGLFPDEEFDFLLDRILRTKNPRWERLEREFSHFQGQQSELNENLGSQIESVRGKLGEVISSIASLEQKNTELSAGTHEWLAIQSLGIDAAEVKVSRFVPLRVYLSDTPNRAVEDVSDAIRKLLEAFKFEISDDFPPIQGSWYKKWYAKTAEATTHPEMIKRLEKIERAVELKGLGQPQADIDKKQSEAVAVLLKSIEKVPNAAIQAGSILLVKITSDSGPVIQVRTLTQRELIQLENNQNFLSSPGDLFDRLAKLCQAPDENRGLDDHEEHTGKKRLSSKDIQRKEAKDNPSWPL
jgi:hypothetical protein